MFDFLDLKDKRILITGASSGIGRETAILLSKLGVKTILVARDEGRLIETMGALEGDDHSYYIHDFTDIAGVEELIQRIVSDGGKLNGFVHSAGITKEMPLPLVDFNSLHEIMLVNFYAFMELSRIFAKKRINDNGGSIVVMSSNASFIGAKALSAYCASKSAVDGAVRALALELHPKGIRVNSVVPGGVRTPMTNKYFEEFGDTEAVAFTMAKQYMGIIEPLYIANAAAFLLSNASFYINGRAFPVDAGSLT